MTVIGVLGAGSWGTTLADLLSRKGHSVRLWAYEQEVPRTSFTVGHAADVAPPLPWPSRE